MRSEAGLVPVWSVAAHTSRLNSFDTRRNPSCWIASDLRTIGVFVVFEECRLYV
jgi:hypothetical protein